MRSELSKKNPYWIPKERYLELKHFVKGYWEYVNELRTLYGLKGRSVIDATKYKPLYLDSDVPYLTLYYEEKLNYIDKALSEVGGDIFGPIILWVIEEGSSYDKINTKCPIPCGRRQFYQMYRQFFWVLDKLLKGHPLTQNS